MVMMVRVVDVVDDYSGGWVVVNNSPVVWVEGMEVAVVG